MAECTRPLWDIAAAAATGDVDAMFLWPFCAWSIDIGLAVVGAILVLVGFVSLLNWSEGWVVPSTWLALTAPMVATAALPGGMIRLIGGILTLAGAMLFIGLWYWWGRS